MRWRMSRSVFVCCTSLRERTSDAFLSTFIAYKRPVSLSSPFDAMPHCCCAPPPHPFWVPFFEFRLVRRTRNTCPNGKHSHQQRNHRQCNTSIEKPPEVLTTAYVLLNLECNGSRNDDARDKISTPFRIHLCQVL